MATERQQKIPRCIQMYNKPYRVSQVDDVYEREGSLVPGSCLCVVVKLVMKSCVKADVPCVLLFLKQSLRWTIWILMTSACRPWSGAWSAALPCQAGASCSVRTHTRTCMGVRRATGD